MKKYILILIVQLSFANAWAQNEGRVGVFTTISKTTLLNKDDKAWGDYLPTFKPALGLTAGYHFTLFKALPIGISAQASYSTTGQNYNGTYEDSTSYYAYSRLRYFRVGGALHFGSNPRRLVSLAMSVGATYGFLTSYQDRYELVRYNNERLIVDVKNSDVTFYDTSVVKGSLNNPLYKKTDFNIFGTLGLDILISQNIVFGFGTRYDMGLGGVENGVNVNINYETTPPSSTPYTLQNLKVKYRGPIDPNVKRAETTNNAIGAYFSFRLRIFNKEKVEFWYKEHRWDEK